MTNSLKPVPRKMKIYLVYAAAFVAILAAVYYLVTKNNDYFQRKPIPSLIATPLLGNVGDLMLQRVPWSELVQTFYNKFPDSKVLGMFDLMTPTYVIRDPELIKQVAVKDFDHFVDHLQVLADSQYDHPNLVTGKTLLSLTGQRWKTMRATLSPAFTGSKMRQMFELIVQCTEQSVRYYEEDTRSKGSQVYEMKDVYTRFANDVIASCAFGIQVDSTRDHDNEFFVNVRKMLEFGRPSALLRFIGYRLVPALMAYLGWDVIDAEQNTYFKKLILGAIEEREKRGIVRPDMVNLLMQARKGTLKHQQEKEQQQEGFATAQESEVGKAQGVPTMTDVELVAQCLIFLLAGFENVSTTLLNATYELTINPDVQQKLYEEIQETRSLLDGKSLSYDTLQKMKYLDMVISEVLRMWPTDPSINRKCTKDYVLDEGNGVKYTVEKGSGLWFPVQGLHHDPKHFPEPEKFDPERFSDDHKGSINTGAYIPFGVGPRNCIESRFALAEMKTILYFMLSSFSFERCAKTEVPPVMSKGFDVIPQNGLYIELRPRV